MWVIGRSLLLVFVVALGGCFSYVKEDWHDLPARDDDPWIGPGVRVVWEQRSIAEVPYGAVNSEVRWLDPERREFWMTWQENAPWLKETGDYLLATEMARSWPTKLGLCDPLVDPSDPKCDSRWEFAVVSVKPTVILMWDPKFDPPGSTGWHGKPRPHDPMPPGVFASFALRTTLPPKVEKFLWFSPDLKTGPIEVERVNVDTGRIELPFDELVLTRQPDGWTVTRK